MRAWPWAWAVGSSVLLAAHGQAIDPSSTRARLGEPLELEVLVRHGHSALGGLAPHCVRATVTMGDTVVPPEELTVSVRPEGIAGWERLRLTHPARVSEPVIDVQLLIRCGAEFSRSFPVLVDLGAGRRSGPPEAHGIPAARRAVAAPPQTLVSGKPIASRVVTPVVASDARQEPSTRAPAGVLLEELSRMRDEQRRLRAELAAVQARLAHSDRSVGAIDLLPWLMPAGVSLLLFLLCRPTRGLVRWSIGSWRRPADHDADLSPPVLVRAAAAVGTSAITPLPARQEESPRDSVDVTQRRMRWADADFGQPSLEGAPTPEALREVERYVAEGYAVASVTLMERALQAQPGKNPWCLLLLLDLYADAQQASQQECVAAQLEALYNVRIPECAGRPIEGCDLLSQPATLAQIVQCWSGMHRLRELSALLLQPVAVEPLDLAAFRDVLLLHAIAQQLADEDGHDEDALIDWPPADGGGQPAG